MSIYEENDDELVKTLKIINFLKTEGIYDFTFKNAKPIEFLETFSIIKNFFFPTVVEFKESNFENTEIKTFLNKLKNISGEE